MLNHAHQLQRQAEKATKKGRVTEAIQKHREAADILHALLETCVTKKAKESVQIQAEFHEREQRLLQSYSQRCDRLAENLAQLRITMEGQQPSSSDSSSAKDYGFSQVRRGEAQGAAPTGERRGPCRPTATAAAPHQDRNLQTNIYRAFDDTETLIERLRGDDGDGTAASAVAEVASSARVAAAAAGGTKKPKDEKVIIEELEVANSHLRNMVDSLFVELDHSRRENVDLKERIHELEEQIRLGELRQRATRNLHPSPSSGRGHPATMDMELPLLPPLDVPTFNFDP